MNQRNVTSKKTNPNAAVDDFLTCSPIKRLSLKEASKMMNISQSTLKEWIDAGIFILIKEGKKQFVPWWQVDMYYGCK